MTVEAFLLEFLSLLAISLSIEIDSFVLSFVIFSQKSRIFAATFCLKVVNIIMFIKVWVVERQWN